MTRSKLGLLVLCATTLGAMAFFASAAQAALSWLVLNASGTAIEVKSEKIVKEETIVNLLASLTSRIDSAKLTYLTKLLGIKIGVTCTAFTTAGINLEPEGKLSAGGKVVFTGCFVSEGGAGCTVKSPGSSTGTIASNEFKGQLVLHEIKAGEKEVLVKLEPVSTSLATVRFEGECSLPESNTVTGVIYFKDSEKFATTHKVKHLIEAGPLTSLLVGTDTAEHLETSIDGSFWAELGGAHLGLAWAAMDNGSTLSWLVLNAAGTIATEVKSEKIVKEEKIVNLLASVTPEVDSAKLTLLTKLVGVKVGVTCTAFTTAGINLEPEGKLSEGGKVVFTGCFVSEGGAACTVKSPGSATGTIAGEELKGELVLHEIKVGEKEVLVKLEPKTAGGSFGTLRFEGECSLPEVNKMTGIIYFKDSEKFATTHKVKHLIEIGPLTSLSIGADTAEHLETTIDGSVWAKLGGAHLGLAWAGMDNAPPPPKLSWLVLNEAGTVATEVKLEGGKVNLPAGVMAELDSPALTLLTKLVGIKVGISCTLVTTSGINLEPEGKLGEGGRIFFTGCFVSEGGAKCTVKSVEAPTETIETEELKGELVLHEIKAGEKEVLVKLEPKSTTAGFVTLLFAGECALPASSKVTGVIYLKDSEKFATTHKVKHLIEVGPLTSLTVGSDSAEHLETTIDGSVWAKLGGAHLGLAWAGMDS